jgi:hypothetical protein
VHFVVIDLNTRSCHGHQASVLEITEFMHLLARIAIADQKLFLNLMSATATSQKTEEDMYEELLEVWFARVSPNDNCYIGKQSSY